MANNDVLKLLTEIEGMLDVETNQLRTGVNTSRSNIKNMRSAIVSINYDLDNERFADAN